MAFIHITHRGTTSSYELPATTGAELTIGRGETNSIPLPDATDLSTNHCRIVRTDEGYAIQDMGSKNGVFLDGRKLEYEMMLMDVPYVAASVQIVLSENAAIVAGTEEDIAMAVATAAAANKNQGKPKAKAKAAASPLAKKVPGLKAAGGAAAPAGLSALAEQYKRKQGLTGLDIVYIVAVLLAAIYAGMALYSWQHDGNPLPILFR